MESFSTLRKVNVHLTSNKDFFTKILKILKYKYSFIQRFMFKFNTRLFLYLVRYLLLQKYCKNYSYSLEAISVGQQVMQYSLLNKFIKNIAVPFSSIINLNSFILHRKMELIRYSKFNNFRNSFNFPQIKVNLFILLFNILLMYRRALKKNKGYTRILLIAFKFQKYL